MDNNKESMQSLEDKLVKGLNEVREIMDKQRDELAVSIRRDVVAVQLKDMLESHSSFYSLKDALESYIKELYSSVEVVEEDDSDEGNNKK